MASKCTSPVFVHIHSRVCMMYSSDYQPFPVVLSRLISTRLASDYQHYFRNAGGLSLSVVLCFPWSLHDFEVCQGLMISKEAQNMNNKIWSAELNMTYLLDDMLVTGKSPPVQFQTYQPHETRVQTRPDVKGCHAVMEPTEFLVSKHICFFPVVSDSLW